MATSEIHTFQAKAIMFATGGYGRAFRITSNAHVGTGDGCALVYKAGLPLEEYGVLRLPPNRFMETWNTCIRTTRGEGGILRNNAGERFMEDLRAYR